MFGKDRVTVRPFDRRFWPDGALLFDFLKAIGAPRDAVPPLKGQVNVSMDYRSIAAMQQFNETLARALAQRPDPSKSPIRLPTRMPFLSSLKAIDRERREIKKMQLSSEQSEEVRLFFQKDNAISLEGSGISPGAFFPKPEPGRPERTVPEELEVETLLRALSILALRMRPPEGKARKARADGDQAAAT